MTNEQAKEISDYVNRLGLTDDEKGVMFDGANYIAHAVRMYLYVSELEGCHINQKTVMAMHAFLLKMGTVTHAAEMSAGGA